MGEVTAAAPDYMRVGICKECGADVYAPEAAAAAGEFKRMSACACLGGPKAATGALDGRTPETEKKAA